MTEWDSAIHTSRALVLRILQGPIAIKLFEVRSSVVWIFPRGINPIKFFESSWLSHINLSLRGLFLQARVYNH